MDKRFIIGGLMFWAGVSGYMGLRVLESYTEDAVFAMLSVGSAQAEEIRYNFLTNALTLKGVEYDIPDEKVSHKGRIESVEVTNFHRKIMFVKPNMPAYDADELPRVGETFKLVGIKDRVHEGKNVTETSIASMDVKGWYQRVGLVLDHFARKGVGEAFFEELFRGRVDEFSAEQIDIRMNSKEMAAPVTIHADRLDIPGGIRAPRGQEKVTPVNIVLDRMKVAQGDMAVSAARVDLRGLTAPDPAQMGRLAELARVIREGKPEAKSEDFMSLLATSWDKRAPFSYLGASGLRLTLSKDADPVTASSASYSMKRDGANWSDSIKCSGLQAKPAAFGALKDSVARIAPEGLKLDVVSDSRADGKIVSSDSSYDFTGLGKLVTSTVLEGDFAQIRKIYLDGASALDPFALADRIKLQKLKIGYSDSGLLPLIFTVVAENAGGTPSVLAQEASTVAFGMATDGNVALRKMGKLVGEQLLSPGSFELEIAPQNAVSVRELIEMLLTKPAELPLTVVSKPGEKPMQEYFLEN